MTRAWPRIVAALVGLACLAAVILFLPERSGAQGLLLSLAIWSGFPIGALVLRMIHGLTGGGWGDVLDPPLILGARLMLPAILAFALLASMQDQIYPWMAGAPTASRAPFLSVWGIDLRGGIILLLWAGLAFVFARRRTSTLAGLGLTLYAVTMSVASADWFMSIDPKRVNTSIGAIIGVQQMLTALCVGAMFVEPRVRSRTVSDIAGLMITCLLGIVYLEMMTYIIHWYGDLPDKVEWYVRRSGVLPLTALSISVFCSIFALAWLVARRHERRHVQLASVVSLVGITAHWIWLLVPDFAQAGPSLAVGLAGICALVLISIAFEPRLIAMDWRPDAAPSSVRTEPAPAPLQAIRPSASGTKVALNPPQSPEVAARPVLAIIFGFLAFVAVSLGGLKFYFDSSLPGPGRSLNAVSPSSSLTIPANQASELKADQEASLLSDSPGASSHLSISQAIEKIVGRGRAAYDPLPATLAREPPP